MWKQIAVPLFLFTSSALAASEEDCTFKGQFSQPCYDFLRESGGKFRHQLTNEETSLLDCFENVKEKPDVALESATWLLEAKASSRYVTECHRLVTLEMGEGWKADAESSRASKAKELEALIASETTGYRKHGAAIRGRLEAFEPFEFRVQAGHCYTAVLRLDQEAAPFARSMQVVFVKSNGEESQGGPGMRGPGGVHSAGCAEKSGKIRVHLETREPGRGGLEVQIFSKSQSAKERVEYSKAVQQAEREARESLKKSQEEAKRTCSRCLAERASCVESKPGHCARAYRVCVERTGVSLDSCE